MNKKKITLAEWTEIGKRNPAAKWLRPFCSYTLTKEPDGSFKREQRVGWPVYIIIFIPAHILQALWCMWDGGLREFEFSGRYLGGDQIIQGSASYKASEKIWNNKNKTYFK